MTKRSNGERYISILRTWLRQTTPIRAALFVVLITLIGTVPLAVLFGLHATAIAFLSLWNGISMYLFMRKRNGHQTR
jgi:O-antigen/teichoic acid export membrane protein